MRLVAFVLLVGTVGASAQAQPAITVGWPAPGSHIRLESSGYSTRQYGTLISADNDSIVFSPEDAGFRTALPTREVVKMDVSRGTHRNILTGAVAGFLVVGGTVAIGVASTWHPTGEIDFGRWGDAAILGVPAGLAGAIIGGVVGAIPRDTWLRVPLPAK